MSTSTVVAELCPRELLFWYPQGWSLTEMRDWVERRMERHKVAALYMCNLAAPSYVSWMRTRVAERAVDEAERKAMCDAYDAFVKDVESSFRLRRQGNAVWATFSMSHVVKSKVVGLFS